MNYDQQITLEQALDLQNKINAGEMPDMSACYRIDNRDIPVHSILDDGDLNTYNGGYYYLTRSDYANYILGNNPLPDGYGYPSKDLGSGLYNGIPYMFCFGDQSNIWLSTGQVFNLKTTTITKWYEVAFKLTDLARVEAEADPKPSMPAHFKPDWKAKYIELEEQHNTLIKHLQEATASADSLQDRLTDAQNCIAVQEREITKLKNYIINQLIND